MYTTMAVHLSNSQGMPRTLAIAASLANRMGATGYWAAPPTACPGIPGFHR